MLENCKAAAPTNKPAASVDQRFIKIVLPLGFWLAATYHRNARRKCVFHAAVALWNVSGAVSRVSRMHARGLPDGNASG
jgi:hypothetical protein